MKKQLNIFILVLILVAGIYGCAENPSSDEGGTIVPVELGDNDYEATPNKENTEEELPAYEYTAEERAALSIRTEKIVFNIGFDSEKWVSDDVSALRNSYPDLELINFEYEEDSNGAINEKKRKEIWHSDSTGMTYYIQHLTNIRENVEVPINRLQAISGIADSLFSGLVASIEIGELMETLGISEAEWSIGDPPESPEFLNYYRYAIWGVKVDTNDIYIVIPDPKDEEWPIGIRIIPSNHEYISPIDEVYIVQVGAFV